MVSRIRNRDQFVDLTLLLGLARCLVDPGFSDDDIQWLNTRARDYCRLGTRSTQYTLVVELIAELFTIVPNNFRDALEWEGPR